MKSMAKRKLKREISGFTCSGHLVHNKACRKASLLALKKGGWRHIHLPAHLAHFLLQRLLDTATDPVHGKGHASFDESAQELLSQLCDLCLGRGWVIGGMGEHVDKCPECNGDGVKLITPRNKKVMRTQAKAAWERFCPDLKNL